MAARPASQDPATYFRATRPFWMLAVGVGLFYYGWAVIAPSTVPYGILGPLGRITQYLQNHHKTAFHAGYLVSWAIHIGEAFCGLWICNVKGITDSSTQLRWFTQTLLFGLPSFYFLVAYKPPKKSQ